MIKQHDFSYIGLMNKMDLQVKVFADQTAKELEWLEAGMCYLYFLYCGVQQLEMHTVHEEISLKDKKSSTNQRVQQST